MAAKRIRELDGLRGWAALTVVVYHIVWETFGVVHPAIHNPLFAVFLNRGLAVALFFVLSGAALSAQYFSTGDDMTVVSVAIKRYSRLTIPILASSLVVFVLLWLQLTPTALAGAIVHRSDWLGNFLLHVPPSPFYFLKWSLAGVYGNQESGTEVNPFLWTMHYELVGSMLVFLVLLLFRHVRNAWAFIAISAIGLSAMDKGFSNYACFLFGIAISAAIQSGVFENWSKTPKSQLISTTMIILVMGIGGSFRLNRGLTGEHSVIFALPLLIAVLTNRMARIFLNLSISQFLGRISFPIFVIQFPVIVSFTAWAIILAGKDGYVSVGEIAAICISSLGICLIAATAFLPVEAYTSIVGRKIFAFATEPTTRRWPLHSRI